MWNSYVPSKVGFFAWEAWWGKVLNMNQLKKRGFNLVSKCPFCGKSEETLEHIMIQCPLIWDLWAIIFATFRAIRVWPFLVRDFLSSWENGPIESPSSFCGG